MKEESLVYQSFIPGVSNHAINEYQLRLDVQRFLLPVYYIIYLSKVTAPQDVHRRLVLQVYLGLNTCAIHR